MDSLSGRTPLKRKVFHDFLKKKVFYSAPYDSTVAVNKSKCMYVCMYVWYVKFKGSLLVEAVQNWPLIGRHVAGELAGSSDVPVLEHSILKLTASDWCRHTRWRLILGTAYYVCRKFG